MSSSSKCVNSIIDTIGNTPLLKLTRYTNLPIYAKAEFLNPGGSIKDRIAKHMIETAEKDGKLKKGMTIVEPTSGNTGIGIALIGRMKGYRVIIIMPENMSDERKKIIRAFGAELRLTPAKESIDGAVQETEKLRKELGENIFVPQQFQNPSNPEIHYLTTGPEIWEQCGEAIGAFVAGVGSAGTIQGVGTFLKEKNPKIKIIAVEPANAAALLGHEPGLHQIQGIGDGFIPEILDTKILDGVVTVSDDDAINTARELARTEGVLVGTSSGANVWASRSAAGMTDGAVVTILADRAERYFSTALI
jgi:cysteine synthase